MNTRQFIEKIDDYNRRLAAAERTLQALNTEKDMLRTQAVDYMRVSQFDEEIGRVTFKFTFPENYQPPADAGQQGERAAENVRHPDQAAQ